MLSGMSFIPFDRPKRPMRGPGCVIVRVLPGRTIFRPAVLPAPRRYSPFHIMKEHLVAYFSPTECQITESHSPHTPDSVLFFRKFCRIACPAPQLDSLD
jgi:hypothetical protein